MLSDDGSRIPQENFKILALTWYLFFAQIPVIADLPVGDNLQDHVMSDGLQFFSPHYMSISAARAENFVSGWQYALFGTGMY